jgi:hypothetical protein
VERVCANFHLINRCVASLPWRDAYRGRGNLIALHEAFRLTAVNHTFFKLIPPIAINGAPMRRERFISDIVATFGQPNETRETRAAQN